MLPWPIQIAAILAGSFAGSLHDPQFIMMLVVIAALALAAPRVIYPLLLAILCAVIRYWIGRTNEIAAGIFEPTLAYYSAAAAFISFALLTAVARLCRRLIF